MIYVIVFNWNHFQIRFLNLRTNFYLLRTFFFLILVVFCVVASGARGAADRGVESLKFQVSNVSR